MLKLEDFTANFSGGKDKVELKILEIDPSKVDVVVKVQEELNYSLGILREGTLTYALAGRDKRPDEKMRDSTIEKMRDSTITYNDHISRFEDNDPDRRKVLAFVGNGNLLMNLWFVAWIKGELFHIKDEPIYRKKEPYSSLVIWKDKRVTIENLWFRADRVKVDDPVSGGDITEEVIYTTYGQRLMKRGQFIAPLKIKEQYYDIRHLLLFPFFGEEKYFGLNEELERDEKKREKALKKQPVGLEFKGDAGKLKEALSEKQYKEAEKVAEEGQYSISDRRLSITFKPGVFPHNMIAVAQDGKVISILVTGRSNTAGLMLDKADKLFEYIKNEHRIVVKDAILLDNGADVMMRYLGKMVAQSFNLRDRLRSVILFVGSLGSKEGIRLIEG